jgi:dolichol-phosphate mannosyltransferase
MEQPNFSIVLPVYKQEDHIRELFHKYQTAFANFEDSVEFLFIVNGVSNSLSYDLKNLVESDSRFRVVTMQESGWGRAVKRGLQESHGKWVCYTNSARTNTHDLIRLLHYAKVDTFPVIKATRMTRDSFLRKLGSILYNFEFRMLFQVPVWDINGTPKILPRRVIDQVALESDGDLIDAELMAKLFSLEIHVVEVPVIYKGRIGGVSTTRLNSAFRMYFGLLSLYRRLRT